MRALVIGASGQVGGALLRALAERGHEAVGTWRSFRVEGLEPLDLRDRARAAGLVERLRPDWIFCTAGMTRADLCEERPADARREIVDDPLALAEAGRRVGSGFLFYSSAYVFDGKTGAYTEAEPPSPINVYGECKVAAERRIAAEVERWIVARTIVVYGPEAQGKNFAYQVLRAAARGERLGVAADQVASTTYNEDLARASVELAERERHGLWHLSAPDREDRYAFARTVCEVFGEDAGLLVRQRTADLAQRAARPLDATLVTARAQRELSTAFAGVRRGLERMRDALGGNPYRRA
ncbi:MAG TPA: SDR family oxidoreductase [Methylomirabilota bacterium]|nr:SDR family oxidoreductase [Methylomirabilota bacterium]